ncbi:TIGR01244 family sulfur transferase [Marinobacter halophilus]|uniref:TIGR01244 family phosphatase n=1 Tax=Marinobacter halophilus TaxID=1323740 RepID=A0A2T1K881_9GAMM|nr:TIGR01244 family sulfur transferase [Marinobacter halophilus]PSF06354.1 TIGR01244 family phosphatase [Marinobacter halophilus]GGC71839.1 NAD(FAD)-dependent dehydrogenase [Marinobacter halophilus]
MDIRKIDDSISVAPQIAITDVSEIARLGFKTLVANRPDREEPGQPAMADIEAAAAEHGLKWVYMPVESGNITDADVDQFATMIRDADTPVFAFCRSGTRCTVLWSLSNARELEPQDILSKAQQAGYDMTGLIPRLLQHASKR